MIRDYGIVSIDFFELNILSMSAWIRPGLMF